MTGPVTGFQHVGMFYRHPTEYASALGTFIEDGLAAGSAVAVAVPAPNMPMLRGRVGPELAARVDWIDMATVGRNPGRIIPQVLLAALERHPGRRTHIVGEPIWPGRTEIEYPACVTHEALINEAFVGRDTTILCPYDAGRLGGGVLADARSTHPLIEADGGARLSDSYRPDAATEFNTPLPAPPADAATMRYERPADLAAVRSFAGLHAQHAGVADVRAAQLRVAVNELATNTLLHTPGSGRITVWGEPGLFVVQLRDSGHLRDPLAGRVPPPLESDHGYGLLLVNATCDLVRSYVDADGTTVRLHIER